MKTTSNNALLRAWMLACAVSVPALAHAETLRDPSELPLVAGPDDQQDVVVTGRGNRQRAAEERDAATTLDTLDTGDTSLQSQTNIADLAKRLPGVSVSHDQGRNQSATGEAQFVSIRGFDTAFNAYTLDGVRLPQTAGNTRAISLNLFSPFAIAGLVADKTPSAASDADSIAGIIDLRSPTAFDFAGPLVRARLVSQANDLALDQGQEGFGGAIGVDMAQRFGSDGQFGIYLAGYYEQRANAAESIATQNDYKVTNAGVGNARDNEGNLSADGLQWNFFNSKIERYGASGSLDYRTDSVDLFARVNYATYNNTNTMNQTGLRSELVSGQTNSNPGRGQYNAQGVYTPFGINPAEYFRVEDVEQALISTQVGGRFRSGGFDFGISGAYADGRFDSPRSYTAAFRGIPFIGTPNQQGAAQEGLQLDLSDPRRPRPILSPGATAYVASLDRPQQYYVQANWSKLSEEKKTIKADLGWTGEGVLHSIRAGGLWERSDRSGSGLSGDQTRFRFDTDLYDGPVPGGPVGSFPGEVLDSFMGYQPVRPIKLLDRSAIEQQIRLYSPTLTIPQSVYNTGLLEGQETRKAAFALATLQFDAGTMGSIELIPGVRYEHNKYDATFWLSDADGDRFVDAGRSFDHVDPSLLAVWRIPGGVIVRGAARSSYSRPAFDQLAGPTRITRDAITDAITAISQPNPDLKPVSAWNYDLGLEYRDGLNRWVQLAGYYKDLKDIIVPTATRTANETVDGIVYSRTYNGQGGSALGVEASARFQVGDMAGGSWLSGLGVGGNVTVQRTRATYRLSPTQERTSALPQAPSVIANAELFYDLAPFRANLWYNYTGRRLITVQDSQPDIYLQPLQELNLGLAVALSPNVELGASVRNLLNSTTYYTTVGKSQRYVSNDRNGGYLETGRVFQFSVTMTM